MMRICHRCQLFAILLLSQAPALLAQQADSTKYGWKKDVGISVNLTQVSFSNWSQGGENSFAWQSIADSRFEREWRKRSWATTIRLAYGESKLGDSDFRKSVDEIKLESVYTVKLGTYINPYIAVTGLTQFTDGFRFMKVDSVVDGTRIPVERKTRISTFLDPGYFTQSIGIGIEPLKNLKNRTGFSLKQTIADEFARLYSDDPATPDKIEKVRFEPGLENVTDVRAKLAQNLSYVGKLELFSNMKSFEQIDVNWENLLTSKVTKLISVNFRFRLLYDRAVSRKRQINQSLGIGLSYTLLK